MVSRIFFISLLIIFRSFTYSAQTDIDCIAKQLADSDIFDYEFLDNKVSVTKLSLNQKYCISLLEHDAKEKDYRKALEEGKSLDVQEAEKEKIKNDSMFYQKVFALNGIFVNYPLFDEMQATEATKEFQLFYEMWRMSLTGLSPSNFKTILQESSFDHYYSNLIKYLAMSKDVRKALRFDENFTTRPTGLKLFIDYLNRLDDEGNTKIDEEFVRKSAINLGLFFPDVKKRFKASAKDVDTFIECLSKLPPMLYKAYLVAMKQNWDYETIQIFEQLAKWNVFGTKLPIGIAKAILLNDKAAIEEYFQMIQEIAIGECLKICSDPTKDDDKIWNHLSQLNVLVSSRIKAQRSSGNLTEEVIKEILVEKGGCSLKLKFSSDNEEQDGITSEDDCSEDSIEPPSDGRRPVQESRRLIRKDPGNESNREPQYNILDDFESDFDINGNDNVPDANDSSSLDESVLGVSEDPDVGAASGSGEQVIGNPIVPNVPNPPVNPDSPNPPFAHDPSVKPIAHISSIPTETEKNSQAISPSSFGTSRTKTMTTNVVIISGLIGVAVVSFLIYKFKDSREYVEL